MRNGIWGDDGDEDMSNMEIDKETILALLSSLGETEEKVRDYLMERGIQGKCGDPRRCPIAIFLWSNGVDTKVDTISGYGECLIVGRYMFDLEEYPALVSVFKFIRKFDAGEYEGLVE